MDSYARKHARKLRSSLTVLAVLVAAPCAAGQRPTPSGPPAVQRSPSVSPFPTQNTDVSVSVREWNGMPLPVSALVKLYTGGGISRTATTQDGGTAVFPKIFSGEYDIEVTAVNYQPAKEHASISAMGAGFTVYVYMHPANETAPGAGGPPGAVMTPRLQSEIDKGLEKQRKREFDEARKHFEKAAKMAPGNPDIQYLLGMLEYFQQHFEAARGKFAAALAIYPSHERALLAMGELQLRSGDAAGAAQTLERAYTINGADWRTHLLLANAYFQQKEYEKALPHASRATELAKNQAAPAWVLLARIQASQGKREEAKRALETVARSFPNDSYAADAKALLADLNKPPSETVVRVSAPVVTAPEPPPPPRARVWAPPDIDSKEYPVVQDVACKQEEVVGRTQARAAHLLGNFEKFLATERIEHQEIDAYGNPGPAREKEFNYIVLVQHPKKGQSFLEERRDGGENLDSFPSALATQGLVGLGVNLFDANYAGDLEYKCEGLGAWRGQPAWRMRFEQKKGVPSEIRTWRNSRGVFPIPLKGRVWVAANSYDVLRVETDLREPVVELQLSRDHLVVDYGPVKFEKGSTTLWLPWSAEMFMELRGKRYHHWHTLTNYMLFSVDTGSTIANPKMAPEQEHPQ